MNRGDIISRFMEELSHQIESLQITVNEYRSASDLDETEPRDTEDLSHQNEAKDMQLRYGNLLAEAQQNLAAVQGLETSSGIDSGLGSILETEMMIFLLGIPVPKLLINGKDAVGIGTDAPVYNDFIGRKAGETVKIGQEMVKIVRIL